MGLFDIFKTSATKQLIDQRVSQNQLNRALFGVYSSGMPFVLKDHPEEFVRTGYMGNPVVYSVINIITRALSAVPFNVYVVKDGKRKTYYKNYSGRKRAADPVRAMNLKKQTLELAEQSDLQGVLERPNPLQGQSEFIENLQGFKEVTGNTYIHGVEVDSVFGELWVMPAHLTEIISDGGLESIIRGYRITEYTYDVELPEETVLHMKYWSPDYSGVGTHLYGMSPIRASRKVLQQSNDSFTAMNRALQNMGAEGMLTLDGEELNQQQVDELQKQIDEKGTGAKNYKKILVSTAKWRWERFGISPTDLNVIASMRETKRELCDIYGISSELMNDPDNKTQANKKEARKGLYYETILPKADSLRDELNRWLVPRFNARDGVEYFIDYDINAVEALSEDLNEKVQALANAWVITGNEFREAIGYDTFDHEMMNTPMMPMNRVPLEGFDLDIDEEIKNYARTHTRAERPMDKD